MAVEIIGAGATQPSGATLDTPPPIPAASKRPATLLQQAQARAAGGEAKGGDLNTDFTMAQALLSRIAVKVPALRDRIGGMLTELMTMVPQAPQQAPQAGAPGAGGQIPMPPPPGAGMGM